MLTKAQYFGMYLGQNISVDKDCGCKYDSVELDSIIRTENRDIVTVNFMDYSDEFNLDDCKLILRPLEDMTEEEVIKLKEITETTSGKIIYFERGTRQKYTIPSVDASITEYLISIGIDVFDCHSKGWVVYESELQKGD
jgi:hypothetical protein